MLVGISSSIAFVIVAERTRRRGVTLCFTEYLNVKTLIAPITFILGAWWLR